MNDRDTQGPMPGDQHGALFASLVLQQSNMALMFLGKIPNPESGQSEPDLPSARIFIDQLEMLETKTKGNLSPQEARMLKDALTTLRMAFVHAVNTSKSQPAPAPPAPPPPQLAASASPAGDSGPAEAAPSAPQPDPTPPSPAPDADADAASKKKFSKKY